MKTQTTSQPPKLSPEAEIALIKKKLKHFTTEKPVKYWLDVGSPRLHSVLGSKDLGIPYGKIFEVAGFESAAKTAQVLRIGGKAQLDGAKVAWLDLENSWDPEWVAKLGVDVDKVYLFKTEVGTFGTEKEMRMHTAEELMEEIEEWVKMQSSKNPSGRLFIGIDSVAAILTEEEEAAGIQDQNMRTKISVAPFLSRLLKRWVALASCHNVMLFFINQLRVAPGMAFGNPEYTPGGNAIRMYASVRVRMRRRSKKVLKGGDAVGIKGTITNYKNKAGGGSKEGLKIGYKFYYEGNVKYIEAEDVQTEGE